MPKLGLSRRWRRIGGQVVAVWRCWADGGPGQVPASAYLRPGGLGGLVLLGGLALDPGDLCGFRVGCGGLGGFSGASSGTGCGPAIPRLMEAGLLGTAVAVLVWGLPVLMGPW